MTTAVFTKKKPFPAELWHHILPYVFNPLLDTMLNFSLSDPICGNDEPIANPRVPSPWYRDRVLRFSTICRLFHDIVVHILRDHLKRMKRLSYEGYINHIEGESRRIRERVENETEQSRSGGQFLDLKLTLRAVEYLARAYISEIRMREMLFEEQRRRIEERRRSGSEHPGLVFSSRVPRNVSVVDDFQRQTIGYFLRDITE